MEAHIILTKKLDPPRTSLPEEHRHLTKYLQRDGDFEFLMMKFRMRKDGSLLEDSSRYEPSNMAFLSLVQGKEKSVRKLSLRKLCNRVGSGHYLGGKSPSRIASKYHYLPLYLCYLGEGA